MGQHIDRCIALDQEIKSYQWTNLSLNQGSQTYTVSVFPQGINTLPCMAVRQDPKIFAARSSRRGSRASNFVM